MKVLQLITGLGQGGAEQVVFDLATRLDRTRYQVSVCSILDLSGAQGVFAERLRDAGLPVRSLGVRGRMDWGRALRLRRVLDEERPDVLHCHMFHANVLGRWAGRRAGLAHIVSTVHIAERRWRPWRFWLERRTDPLGSITVCVADAVLEFQMAKTGLPRHRFTVIRNGIDTARFAAPARPRDEVRRELGVSPDARLLGSVGRLDPQKGYSYLLEALASLAAQFPDLQLVLAGEGPERARLESLAASLGCSARVHLIGRRTDVADLLHSFDVFVLPSVYEGLPLALIEAMAAGVPVVATRVDSAPEVLGAHRREGLAGVLVPPRDPANLAGAIADALLHPLPSRVELARARARREFDVSVMVARYAELYDAVAGQTLDSPPADLP